MVAGRRAVARVAGIAAAGLILGCSSPGNVFSVGPGDCFDDPDAAVDEISDVSLVACDEPHDNEVYAVAGLEDGDYPGDAAVLDRAQDICLDAFEPYVAEPYDTSQLFATWLVPTEGSWSDGDREVVCVLFDAEGPLEGSMRDRGR
ncbi:MAG: septum formation family protein [Intrasporangiaceae bacterium]|nr:septum formation family protein [Intrasporangiaceae bacterium]